MGPTHPSVGQDDKFSTVCAFGHSSEILHHCFRNRFFPFFKKILKNKMGEIIFFNLLVPLCYNVKILSIFFLIDNKNFYWMIKYVKKFISDCLCYFYLHSNKSLNPPFPFQNSFMSSFITK